jgi:hypothetical protein
LEVFFVPAPELNEGVLINKTKMAVRGEIFAESRKG